MRNADTRQPPCVAAFHEVKVRVIYAAEDGNIGSSIDDAGVVGENAAEECGGHEHGRKWDHVARY